MSKTTYHYYNAEGVRFRVFDWYDESTADFACKVVKVTEEVLKDVQGVITVVEHSDKKIVWILETSDSIRHPFATYAAALRWVIANVSPDIVMVSDDTNSSDPDGLRAFRNKGSLNHPVVTIREELLMG